MNEVNMNADAWKSAVLCVVGPSTAELIGKTYDAVDLAERRGIAAGFEQAAALEAENAQTDREVALWDVEAAKLEAYNEGFQNGAEQGELEGYERGQNGCDDAYERGVIDGYARGYSEGINAGSYEAGYNDGTKELFGDYSEGYSEGVNAGNQDVATSFDEGYEAGYGDGVEDATAVEEMLDVDFDGWNVLNYGNMNYGLSPAEIADYLDKNA